MIEVENCVTRAQLHAFARLERQLDRAFRPAPTPGSRFAARYLPRGNPLMQNGEYRFLLASERGRPLMRVMTGTDRRFNRLTGLRQGYIALFEGFNRPDAARALFEQVARFQRSLGNERVFGPDACDGGGFGAGVLVEGFDRPCAPLNAYNPPYYEALLLECGFRPEREYLCFELSLRAAAARYVPLADWARARFGVTVERARFACGREACGDIGRIMDGRYCAEDVAMFLERSISGRLNSYLLIARAHGRPAGFALAVGGRRAPFRAEMPVLRLATLMVAREYRRGPAAGALLGALCGAALREGYTRLEASVIDRENAASAACARGAGGYIAARYRQYALECKI